MKNKIISISFIGILITVFLLNSILSAKVISNSERRKLSQFPELSINTVLNGEFTKKYEKYLLDQIVLRDTYRTIKTLSNFYIFHFYDQHGIYLKDNHVFKMEYPYHQLSVEKMADKINYVYEKYLNGMNVYFSLIPDKNYYSKDEKYLFIDYDNIEVILKKKLKNLKYISLFDCLSLDDYYKTDLHWKQENINEVAEKLLSAMNKDFVSIDNEYDKKLYYPYYGSYYGQSALPLNPDTITYLSNNVIDNATVYYYTDYKSSPIKTTIYNQDDLLGVDSYDIFLSGAKPIVEINNNISKYKKELIIFRDSFASSLSPLLLSEYSKITLVDLRYISSDLVGDFINFKNQDVLFLYNTLIINNSEMIK